MSQAFSVLLLSFVWLAAVAVPDLATCVGCTGNNNIWCYSESEATGRCVDGASCSTDHNITVQTQCADSRPLRDQHPTCEACTLPEDPTRRYWCATPDHRSVSGLLLGVCVNSDSLCATDRQTPFDQCSETARTASRVSSEHKCSACLLMSNRIWLNVSAGGPCTSLTTAYFAASDVITDGSKCPDAPSDSRELCFQCAADPSKQFCAGKDESDRHSHFHSACFPRSDPRELCYPDMVISSLEKCSDGGLIGTCGECVKSGKVWCVSPEDAAVAVCASASACTSEGWRSVVDGERCPNTNSTAKSCSTCVSATQSWCSHSNQSDEDGYCTTEKICAGPQDILISNSSLCVPPKPPVPSDDGGLGVVAKVIIVLSVVAAVLVTSLFVRYFCCTNQRARTGTDYFFPLAEH